MRASLSAALLALTLACGAAAASAAGPAPVPPNGEHRYNIMREGARIGTQISRYTQDGNRLTVVTQMNIEVSLLFVTAYKFEMESREEWVGGRFVAMTTRANDDGKRKEVDVRVDDGVGKLLVSYNGKDGSAPAGTFPASLWNPATVEKIELVDVLNGKTRDVRTRSLGTETLRIGGQDVQAYHYVMQGDLERELWYGADGQLLQVVFEGPDGSAISIVKTSL